MFSTVSRLEFSAFYQLLAVIGQKVNMAARLMTNFPDSVSCDDSTRSKSVLPAQQFTATPPIELKGISNPEPMFYVSDETLVYWKQNSLCCYIVKFLYVDLDFFMIFMMQQMLRILLVSFLCAMYIHSVYSV